MNAELQAIKDLWTMKTAAKHRALEAIGEARLAEKEGRDAKPFWDKWEVDGIQGNEKKYADEQLALCDAYVAAHPEEFTELENLSLEECVQAHTVFKAAGMEESEWRVETWLRYRFPPQNIGGKVEARVRMPLPSEMRKAK